MIKSIYVIGSLRNPEIPKIAAHLRLFGFDVFDDWHSAGPDADDHWRDYEKARGHNMAEALAGHAAQHVFSFDRKHLQRCDASLLIWPAGKSGHLELGYAAGLGKHCYVITGGEPERFDVMLNFASGVFTSLDEFLVKAKIWQRVGCVYGDADDATARNHCGNPRCVNPAHRFYGTPPLTTESDHASAPV